MDSDNKQIKKWLEVLMRDEGTTADINILIGHLCWKNLEFSKRVGKIILKACNSNQYKDLEAPLTYAKTYLGLQDEFQTNRMEWLLGFPDFATKADQEMGEKLNT